MFIVLRKLTQLVKDVAFKVTLFRHLDNQQIGIMKLKMINLFCILPLFLCLSRCVWWCFPLFPILNDFSVQPKGTGGCCPCSPHLGVVARRGEPLITVISSQTCSEGCLFVRLYNFCFWLWSSFIQLIGHCFKMFIFGFLFVCVVPMMWQVLGKMPAYMAQERPCHTVITHDSDCKRRFLSSLGVVSCKFKQHQTSHLILGLIVLAYKIFRND